MKKVLILVNHHVVIYNFRREIVEALLDRGYEVIISSPYGEHIDTLKAMGAKYVESFVSRHGTNVLEDMKLMFYYMKLMREIKPDVVLSYTIKPNIYGGMAAEILGVPYIANITGLGSAVENGGLIQKLTIFLYKIAFKKVDCVFFQNKENRSFFESHHISKGKYRLLPGSGVNLKQFSVLPYPNTETIEFVFISRIMKEKGIDQYLEVARRIRKKYPHTRFHICGFCEEAYEGILQDAQAQGIITYHGMVKDIRTVLKDIHCTIHPSYYPEGLSNVLLESMASGRPIITTNRSGCKETVDVGKNGFIVALKSTEDLFNKVEAFLALDDVATKQMGLAGRQKAETEFDRQIVVEAYIDETNRVMGES